MKRYILLSAILVNGAAFAQVPEDAIRYSFFPQNGTARNLAIGGAMGSLGGDVNATFVNPAGLGFYKTSEVVFTPGILMHNQEAGFRGSKTSEKKNHFSFGTTGFVLGFSDGPKSKTSNALSFAVTQTASFNNVLHYKGLNNYSSFSEQFAEEFAKSGYTIDEALSYNTPFPYSSAPALYTYLIDTVREGGNLVVKGAPEYILDAGQALSQEMTRVTKGGITEVAIGFAHNSNDKWFIGGSIGIPIISYKSNTSFTESDTSSNTSNHFKSFSYTDDFTTKGYGINFKLGIIYRPQEYIRLGLAIHTPSWMSLKDTRTTYFATQLENPIGNFDISSQTFTGNEPGRSRYAQNSTWKAILSASYVFREVENVKRQKGFITADIEYVNHRGTRFNADKDDEGEISDDDKAYYRQLNQVVKAQYKGNFNFRVGGELKFNVLMARLGFAYYSNPYKDSELKASQMLLSGGLGYRNKGMFVDLTYVYGITKDVNFPYRLEDRANTFASTKDQKGNIVATVGFKF